jgi:uncharacterized protein (DUF58 family)
MLRYLWLGAHRMEKETPVKVWITMLLGILICLLLYYALSVAAGLIFWIGLIVVIGSLITWVLGLTAGERKVNPKAERRNARRLEKTADHALKNLERQTQADRKQRQQ